MSKGRANISACMLGSNLIYAIGGNTSGTNIFNDIEQYNINLDEWKLINIANN